MSSLSVSFAQAGKEGTQGNWIPFWRFRFLYADERETIGGRRPRSMSLADQCKQKRSLQLFWD